MAFLKRFAVCAAIVVAAFGASGCAVYSVADATVSIAADVVETTVDVAAGTVDLVTP